MTCRHPMRSRWYVIRIEVCGRCGAILGPWNAATVRSTTPREPGDGGT